MNVYKINTKPGGKKPKMKDTVKVQYMIFRISMLKVLIHILTERGNIDNEEVCTEMASHTNFKAR